MASELQSLYSKVSEHINHFQWIQNETFLSSIWSPIIASILYLLIGSLIHFWMKKQKPFSLKGIMMLHNAFLVLISAYMFFGIVYELYKAFVQRNESMYDLICDPTQKYATGPLYWYCYVFYLSKYYEFLDTLFIVLKKRPLTFLHVYHHILTLSLTWAGMSTITTNQWAGAAANTFIHMLMYYYYLISSLGYNVWWKKYLTTMQMIQFWGITGMLLLWLYYHVQNQPVGCAGQLWSWFACLFGQVTFFILFQNFYNKTYNATNARKSQSTKKD